ncbi:Metallo-dependent phosphatase-like protein [Lasiosphaeria hispida]|uniref:Metallo-dependent phosphatase-like protein n=1 Tax=Lasiosphaeria hispida TaxID=260671 RepID=A0AAJ0MAW2_9PEZI|nr:Metallo-dependent phosphatase-like protein [Lasiosphaeria hispida]
MLFASVVRILDLVVLGRLSSVPWRKQASNGDQDSAPLTFRPDGTFQISIFEDLHFGENAWDTWGPQQDINSVKVLNTVLDTEPAIDLVVLNGDLITGENTFLENSTHYLDQIIAPLLDRNLTWASTYGNHDSDFNLSRSALLAREQQHPNARTTNMLPNTTTAGVTNYYLPIHPHACPSCAPALLLWFFDSRGGFAFQQTTSSGARVGQPNWVDAPVATWFRDTNAALVAANDGQLIPALAFVHIPINASLALQDRGVDEHRQPGINDDVPLARQAQGWCPGGTDGGGCEYGGQDGAFMEAVAGTEGLVAVFSGHDHGDSWCYRWDGVVEGMAVEGKGVTLCFGQRSGYGGYGSWIRGARQVVVTMEEDGVQVDTFVRLESGDVVGAVTLNETYGLDSYPATPNDKTRCPTLPQASLPSPLLPPPYH